MAEAARKPDVCELVGIALNTSALTFRENHEGALDRIAALGAASLAIRLGVDRSDLPIAAAPSLVYGKPIDAQDALAGELAPMLAHVRYGRQHELVPRAVPLFASWICFRTLFKPFATLEHQALRLAFSARVLHEWLSDKCPQCRGSRKQQKSASGQWVAPLGNMQRNAIFRICTCCHGSGRPLSSPPQRMKALGIDRARYEEERWDQRFTAAFEWLNRFLPPRLQRALTAELGRRTRRPR